MSKASEWGPQLQFTNVTYAYGPVVQVHVMGEKVGLKFREVILTAEEAKRLALWILNIFGEP